MSGTTGDGIEHGTYKGAQACAREQGWMCLACVEAAAEYARRRRAGNPYTGARWPWAGLRRTGAR